MIRDLCASATGSWSANQVYAHACLLKLRGTRSTMMSAIKNACGESGKKGGPRVALTGTLTDTITGTRTSSLTDTQKEKKEAKKRKSKLFTPSETSSLLSPKKFGDIEADVAAFLGYLDEKNGHEMTLAKASVAVSSIAKARDKHGDTFVVDLLDKTIEKNAETGYFRTVSNNTLTGTHSAPKFTRSTGTRPRQEPDVEQLNFVAHTEERQAERLAKLQADLAARR
jgi:hypothetical protein